MSGESPTESVVLAEICLFDFGVSNFSHIPYPFVVMLQVPVREHSSQASTKAVILVSDGMIAAVP
jgi:hypothetical protein